MSVNNNFQQTGFGSHSENSFCNQAINSGSTSFEVSMFEGLTIENHSDNGVFEEAPFFEGVSDHHNLHDQVINLGDKALQDGARHVIQHLNAHEVRIGKGNMLKTVDSTSRAIIVGAHGAKEESKYLFINNKKLFTPNQLSNALISMGFEKTNITDVHMTMCYSGSSGYSKNFSDKLKQKIHSKKNLKIVAPNYMCIASNGKYYGIKNKIWDTTYGNINSTHQEIAEIAKKNNNELINTQEAFEEIGYLLNRLIDLINNIFIPQSVIEEHSPLTIALENVAITSKNLNHEIKNYPKQKDENKLIKTLLECTESMEEFSNSTITHGSISFENAHLSDGKLAFNTF